MDLVTALQDKKILVFDGGMGSQLARYGLDLSGGINNLSNPDTVQKVHREYAESGADVLITNTLTMNPVHLKEHNLDIDLKEVNEAGVKLAKQGAVSSQFVLGDIGSTGQLLKPYGTYEEDQFYIAFKEQAKIHVEAGVDGFIIETMMDLREALCALRACKEISSLPAIVSFSFSTTKNGGRTMMGNSAEECAKAVADAGGDVIGANCGDLDPEEMAEIVATFKKATSLPILVQPNAGKPILEEGKTTYNMSPADFTMGIGKCIQAGATLIGGCCGTTPEHIKEIAKIRG